MTIADEPQSLATDDEFHYRNCWYPVLFMQDWQENPYSFCLYGEPLVIFRDQQGKWGCLLDRCPHRLAKLSTGQVIDGRLECLYHGWQFETDGSCSQIPQLQVDGTIPRNAKVKSYPVVERQGVLWVWLGKQETAKESDIPLIKDLEVPNCVHTDYVIDFPYEQGYLLENLLDPAHVNISHDRSEFGAKRENAQPLAFQILEISARGIRSQWRNSGNPQESWKNLDFIAPNLVHYRFSLPNPDWCAGLALYGISLGQGRSRLLVRRYQNFAVNSRQYRWRWLEHLRQSRILEDDLPLIQSQQEMVEKSRDNLQKLYLPLKTSDSLVIELRQWFDRYGDSLPYYQGYTSHRTTAIDLSDPLPLDRYSRHTVHCSTCSAAHKKMVKTKQIAIGIGILLALLAILSPDQSLYQINAVILAILALGIAIAAHYTRTKFERTYEKKPNIN
jgi:phenylpropionate dioxygenase-like ring-hydroxylating dioxygenase large terminal subunit